MLGREDPWVWTYDVEDLGDEYHGWRHPVWIGGTGWVNDDDENHYLNTVVVRVPGKRYVVIAMPIKRRIKWLRICSMAEIKFGFGLDGTPGTSTATEMLALNDFISGEQPYSYTFSLEKQIPDSLLIPEGGEVVRGASSRGSRSIQLVKGDGWTLKTVQWDSGEGMGQVTAVTREQAEEIGSALYKLAQRDDPPEDEADIRFWFTTPYGSKKETRSILAPRWDEISQNYSVKSGGAIHQLMKAQPSGIEGRIVLMHGPPGTGKTTVMRSLAREWKDWCDLDTVLDPEAFFADPSYLMEVITQESEREWKLVVLEDCDELIRSDSKKATGQSLSRLLNLTDGMLGQGRKIMVAITTNEPVHSLHPAIIRPGRCLAQIEVGALSAAEASAWLGGETIRSEMSLAELYAHRNNSAPVAAVGSEEPAPWTGQYV